MNQLAFPNGVGTLKNHTPSIPKKTQSRSSKFVPEKTQSWCSKSGYRYQGLGWDPHQQAPARLLPARHISCKKEKEKEKSVPECFIVHSVTAVCTCTSPATLDSSCSL